MVFIAKFGCYSMLNLIISLYIKNIHHRYSSPCYRRSTARRHSTSNEDENEGVAAIARGIQQVRDAEIRLLIRFYSLSAFSLRYFSPSAS